jgi:hypothetical protein
MLRRLASSARAATTGGGRAPRSQGRCDARRHTTHHTQHRHLCAAAPPDATHLDNTLHADDQTGATIDGLNIFKEGDDPEIKADDQYPEWLWTM